MATITVSYTLTAEQLSDPKIAYFISELNAATKPKVRQLETRRIPVCVPAMGFQQEVKVPCFPAVCRGNWRAPTVPTYPATQCTPPPPTARTPDWTFVAMIINQILFAGEEVVKGEEIAAAVEAVENKDYAKLASIASPYFLTWFSKQNQPSPQPKASPTKPKRRSASSSFTETGAQLMGSVFDGISDMLGNILNTIPATSTTSDSDKETTTTTAVQTETQSSDTEQILTEALKTLHEKDCN